MDYEIRHILLSNWLAPVYVGVLLLLTFARTLYARRFSEWVQLAVTDKYFAMEGKVNAFFHPFNLLLFGVQVLAFSMLIYQYLAIESPDSSTGFLKYLQIVSGYTVFVTFKFYLEKLIAHVLDFEALLDRYLYEKLSYLNLMGMVLMVILPFLSFSLEVEKIFYLVLFGVLALFYLLILFSTVKRNQELLFRHFFYFILYLCALELAPLVILYQVFVFQG